MSHLRLTDKIFLLLLLCLFGSKGTSMQEGSSYFFYQQSEYPKDCKEARDQCSTGNLSGVYTIKPDGYPEPFEVYCNNDFGSGGWTVIQRRSDGSITFDRSWEDYKNGFGFLSAEFWIGNDKLSYLTNQAVYELHIDMMLSNGSSFYVKYSSFRISDELSHYALVLAEEYRANISCVVSTCLPGTTHNGCSCQQLCIDPVGMTGCSTDCVELCALYTDCYEAYQAGERQDGVYTILPTRWSGSPFNVSCDMTTAGGGWTIFQRRTDALTDFYRDWDDYKHGFGSVEQGHDLWLGNEKIYSLTNQAAYKLRVDIRTSSDVPKYAEYTTFRVDDESSKYQLTVTGYSGDAGNSMGACVNGGKFSTRDQDNDGCSVQDFAEGHKGAWWYNTAACARDRCTECRSRITACDRFETRSSCYNQGASANLNGIHNGGNGENIFWAASGCNLYFAEMKIRPSLV